MSKQETFRRMHSGPCDRCDKEEREFVEARAREELEECRRNCRQAWWLRLLKWVVNS